MVGYETGFDVGRELGYYLGSLEAWLALSQKFPNKLTTRFVLEPQFGILNFSDFFNLFISLVLSFTPASLTLTFLRNIKTIQALHVQIKELIFDPDQPIMYLVENVRNKFKVLASQLGVDNKIVTSLHGSGDLSF